MTVFVGGGNCGSSYMTCALGATGHGGLCTMPHCRQGHSSAASVGFRLMWSQCQTLEAEEEPEPSQLSPHHCACRAPLCRTLLVGKSLLLGPIPLGLFQRHLLLGRKADKSRPHIKKQRHHFANKGLYSQSCGFSNSHIQV